MVTTQSTFWRRCSNCKKEIALGAKYHVCSVASCTKVRAPVQFCSADCWAVHNEVENHKDAWAVEHTAPKTAEAPPPERPERPERAEKPKAAPSAASAVSSTPKAASTPPSATSPAPPASSGDDVMVVVSRLKDFIKESSAGMSTSEQVLGPFSDHVRRLADRGIEAARADNRKTVLDRDIPRPAAAPGSSDVLVVVKHLKEYVRARSDFRTSDEVPATISAELRRIAVMAIEAARRDGRKTVLGRDVPR